MCHARWITHSIMKPFHWLGAEIPVLKVQPLSLTEFKRLGKVIQLISGKGMCSQSPSSSHHIRMSLDF